MDDSLKQDLNRFFHVYQSRISDLIKPLPQPLKNELDEELNLLRVSVLRRLEKDLGD